MIQRELKMLGLAVTGLAAGLVAAATGLGDEPAKSFDAVLAEVQGLKKQEVAWRSIPWKTCLLDGLRESREKNKPILLWIFIDRPIDDERC